MFISPYFGGCKYTNNFLFINKNIVFQHFGVLITMSSRPNGASDEISSPPSDSFLRDILPDGPQNIVKQS